MCYEVGLDWIVQYLILLPLCLQATGVREDQILVTILPGLPTAAEFFLLPDKRLTEGKAEKSSAHLDQVSQQPAPSAPVSSSRHCMSGRIYFPSLSSLKFHHAKVWIKSLLFPAFVSHGLIPFFAAAACPVIAPWNKSSSFLQQMSVLFRWSLSRSFGESNFRTRLRNLYNRLINKPDKY